MKKTFLTPVRIILAACLLSGTAFADFKEHFDLGQSYMSQYQYSGAISEFKSALRINYLDNSARIGLINAYLSRGTEYANKDRAWEKAADDYRSALFLMMYYQKENQNTASFSQQAQRNLENCLRAVNFDTTPQNRFETAKKLRANGNFYAAAYEFMQALGDTTLQKTCFEQVGEIMKVLGNEPKAADYYKKAIAVAPTDLDLRLSYAKILDNLHSDDDALKEYTYVLQRTLPEDRDILYRLEKIFRKKLEESPNNANFNVNMGAILQKEGKTDAALNYYKLAETLDPTNINTRINTGTLYQQKGDYKTAIKAYESVLILYPDNIDANLYRAQCYDKIGETKTAQDGFRKVLALDPENPYLKAQMVENAKKTMQPEQFAEYVKANMPTMNPAGIIYDYAIELHKKGKLDTALAMYNEAIKANGKNPEIYVNMALAQAQANKFDDALNTLNNAKVKFPQSKEVSDTAKNISAMKTDNLLASAASLFEDKKYSEAIKIYSAIKPETFDSVTGIASSYKELGNLKSAIAYYKKALELKPLNSDIAYYIACLYGESEDFKNAKDYLEKAITFNPENTPAKEFLASIEDSEKANLLNDAVALYEADKYDESLIKFNELLSKDPKNSYALYYRGMIYDTKEKRKEAIADLSKAYELNNEFTICNYLIASDYDALGKYKEAYDFYLSYANSEVPDDEYKQYAKARVEELKEYAKK